MTIREEVEQYATSVVKGQKISGKSEVLACKRYFRDIKEAKSKGFYFDEKSAEAYIKFIELLPHVKGKAANEKRLLKLEPVQKFMIWNLFGWKWERNRKRRFRHAYIQMAKKNAKSTLAAAIGLAMFVLDCEEGAEIYSAATSSDQANEVFEKTAVRMWTKSEWLQRSAKGEERITKSQYQLKYKKYGSYFKALPGDSDTAEGKNAHCAIIDEYHVHKSDDLVNNIVSGSITRSQPLIIRITTAGVSQKAPCYAYRNDCIKVLEQITNDETLFVMIFELDEKDWQKNGWKNKKNWPKAHPLWDSNEEVRDGVESEFAAAIRSTTKEIDFKTKMLNIWTNTAKTWIEDGKYMKSVGKMDITKNYDKVIESLKGRQCYGGMDLSKAHDFSALTLLFPNDDGTFDTLYYFWLPEVRAENRAFHHQQNFFEWRDKGFMTITEGDVIDHQIIRQKILELSKYFVINSIAYDSTFAITLVTELTQDGIEMNPYGQGPRNMGAPIYQMEQMIMEKKMHHFGNPVMRWMMSNVMIVRDGYANMKIDKEKSHESVDGPVSNAMAIGQYLRNPQHNYVVA
jgi:phage terminase large subunit-like protein